MLNSASTYGMERSAFFSIISKVTVIERPTSPRKKSEVVAAFVACGYVLMMNKYDWSVIPK